MIEVIKDSRVPDFCHKTQYSAGYDLYACLDTPIVVQPDDTVLVPTGIRVNMMSDPKIISRAISKAVNSRRPRPRYLIGMGAKPLVFLHTILPTRLFDYIMKHAS